MIRGCWVFDYLAEYMTLKSLVIGHCLDVVTLCGFVN